MFRQYSCVHAHGNYWPFTLTDGSAKRHAGRALHTSYSLGLQPAADCNVCFLFYETLAVITNLVGGYLGARIGSEPDQ